MNSVSEAEVVSLSRGTDGQAVLRGTALLSNEHCVETKLISLMRMLNGN